MKRNQIVRSGFNPYKTGEIDDPEFIQKLRDGRIFYLKNDDGSLLAYEHSSTRAERAAEKEYQSAYAKYAVEAMSNGETPLEFGVWEMPIKSTDAP